MSAIRNISDLKGKGVLRDQSGQSYTTNRECYHLKPKLDALPVEILELIALYCANDSTSSLSASSSSTIDRGAEALLSNPVTPPYHFRNLLLLNRRIYSLLNTISNSQLYARIFQSKFDVEAIARRFGESAVSSVNLTNELQKRCICLKRMKRAVSIGRLFPEGQDEQSRMEMEENLWLAFMMMMENDGLNIQQLQWARLEGYLSLHHLQDMLESAFKPQYPVNTPDRALALHLQYLLSNPAVIGTESQEESDQKLFVLRPFVFAAHKFDPFYAPWSARRLPLLGDEIMSDNEQSVDQNPFLTDRTHCNQYRQIQHCGQQVSICSPNATQAACFSFFLKVERDPAVVGLDELDQALDRQRTMLERRNEYYEAGQEGQEVLQSQRLKSIDYDRDMKRLLSCLSPSQSPGLKTFFHLGQFEGSWEGRFAYFDFDNYRDMMGGKLASLYGGRFGEQPQVWKVKEHIVRLGDGESSGGVGDTLNAGYYPENDEPTDRESMTVAQTSALLQGASLKNDNGLDKHTRMYQDSKLYPTFGVPQEYKSGSIDDEEDRYEILLSGTGHSAWGRFILRGRVRSWDGMLIMTKEYRPDGRGRWLYRGYVTAGGKMVGRWRDTFTPEEMCGYEGCFLLNRREND